MVWKLIFCGTYVNRFQILRKQIHVYCIFILKRYNSFINIILYVYNLIKYKNHSYNEMMGLFQRSGSTSTPVKTTSSVSAPQRMYLTSMLRFFQKTNSRLEKWMKYLVQLEILYPFVFHFSQCLRDHILVNPNRFNFILNFAKILMQETITVRLYIFCNLKHI